MKSNALYGGKIVTAVVFLLTGWQAVAQDFDAGLIAYERGEYAIAEANWIPLASRGDVGTQGLELRSDLVYEVN